MNKIISAASKYRYKVSGFNLENFLFRLTSGGIGMKKVKRKKHSLYFTASASYHDFISSAAEEFGLKIAVVRKLGLSQLLSRLPYCVGGLLGLAFSVVFIIHMTSYVASIDIDVPKNHSCNNGVNCIYQADSLAAINQYLADNGVSVGHKYTGKTKKLQDKVIANFELVENCSITKKGCKVNITLNEATSKEQQQYTKIVAQDNCVISSITTFSGVAKVKAGDVVVAGQTLVEADGDVPPSAEIKARVWHYATELFDQNQTQLVRTGKTQKITTLSIFGKTIIGGGKPKFGLYQADTKTSYTSQNTFLPILRQTVTYYEVELKTAHVDYASVQTDVRAKAHAAALAKVPPTASVIDCHYSEVAEGDLVRVDCYITCEEFVGIKQ